MHQTKVCACNYGTVLCPPLSNPEGIPYFYLMKEKGLQMLEQLEEIRANFMEAVAFKF